MEYRQMLRDTIDEQQKRQQETNKALTEYQKSDCVVNRKQMQTIVEREQITELERRSDRRKADNLSKFNNRHRRESKYWTLYYQSNTHRIIFESIPYSIAYRHHWQNNE